MDEIRVAPPVRTQVAVVGAGIAGTWTALKLARAGIRTLLIDYSATDRGGVLGSTARSVGAVNTSPMDRADFCEFMDELGQGQVHPSTVGLLLKYLPEELAELQGFGEFKRIKLGVALANGNAGNLLRKLQVQFVADGGQMLDAWVTRIAADETSCQGVQYQRSDGTIGQVYAPVVVLSCGGYAGLFDGSVKTNNFGTMLGRFLQAGGLTTNMEFIFKHGYGKPDLGALTPTEELPGAEVYDDSKVHVEWLERELYEGRGTANHLEAFRHWRNNKHHDFFIDLQYRELYARVQALNAAYCGGTGVNPAALEAALSTLTTLCPEEKRHELEGKLRGWVQTGERVDFERFGTLKPFFADVMSGEVFRVRQIAYFSMGGAAHIDCETNLANVFVNGEAMHDFGAHRVGGLPWGLYLCAGRLISDRIVELLHGRGVPPTEDFELLRVRSHFDPELLQEIREKMHRFQERDLNIVDATKFISWIRAKRRTLVQAGRALDDAVAWTLVAEGVMQGSLRRAESRGCFYRADHPISLTQMKRRFTCMHYDAQGDVVPAARLIRIAELPGVLLESQMRNQPLTAVG